MRREINLAIALPAVAALGRLVADRLHASGRTTEQTGSNAPPAPCSACVDPVVVASAARPGP